MRDSIPHPVTALIAGLVLLDVFLSIWGYFFPETWFSVFHGVPYDDPEGLLRRSAGNWAAFALFQAIAFFRWEKAPYWLAVVAGIRFSDIFTDLSYALFAQNLTTPGAIMLYAAGPLNLIIGLYLFNACRRFYASPEGFVKIHRL